MSDAVKTALIAGIVSVVIAVITAITQTKETLRNETPGFIEGARAALDVTGVPIGTVVASMLPPKQFATLVGDETNFNPSTAKWVPADGRSVAGSKYATVATTTAPDLRGVFIRGLNYSEPDRVQEPLWADVDTNRTPGSRQSDSLKEHSAMFPGQHQVQTTNTSGFWAVSPQSYNGVQTFPVAGDKETRPKNIALFYYININ